MNASMVEEVFLLPINATNPYDYIDLLVLGADGEMAKHINTIKIKRGTTSNAVGAPVEIGTCAVTFYMGEVVSGDISETLAINQDLELYTLPFTTEGYLFEGKVVDLDINYQLVPATGKYRKYATIYCVDVVSRLSNYKLEKAWAQYEKPTKYDDYLPGSETWLERLTNLETRINALNPEILFPQTEMDFPSVGEAKVVYAI